MPARKKNDPIIPKGAFLPRGVLVGAARDRDLERVKGLIDKGADLNATDSSGMTALMWAAFYGEKDIVRVLIRAGANVNLRDQGGDYALLYWVQRRDADPDIVRLFLQKGVDVNAHSGLNVTPLILACEKSNKKIVALLLQQGAEIECRDNAGRNAMSAAQQAGDPVIIGMLEQEILRRRQVLDEEKTGREKEIQDAVRDATVLKKELTLPPPLKLKKRERPQP